MLKQCHIQVEEIAEIRAMPGELFLEVLNRRGIDLHNDCGGQGKCGKCRIRFVSPAPECLDGDRFHLNEDERAGGMRLACFHQVREDCRIVVPPAPEPELLDDL